MAAFASADVEIEDHHSIYIRAAGHTADEVVAHVGGWIASDPVQQALAEAGASSDYILSLATNVSDEFLGYGYLYCVSSALYHIMLGRQATGLSGILVPQAGVPCDYDEILKWPWPAPALDWVAETERALPPPTLVAAPPLFRTTGTYIQLHPARVLSSRVTSYLRAWSVPARVTARQLWEVAHIYATKLIVYVCHERGEALLQFPVDTYDAMFAAFFLRKVTLPPRNIVLVFRPLRADEKLPHYKNPDVYTE
jgi:hypothetical protein